MKRFLPQIALTLVLAQLLLMLGSWLWSAALPLSGVRSMLSGEGIRWFLGHFAEIVASPVLVWLLLLAMAYGAVVRSRGVSVVFLVIYVGIVLLLTVVPHAVLLSASGLLWPSPFSASLVPLVAFGVKSLEKRQNELVKKLFPGGESVNATRLVVRALELHILDIDNLEADPA